MSKSEILIRDVSISLKQFGFRVYESYNCRRRDDRVKKGFTVISRVDLAGKSNLMLWMSDIGFSSPKHLDKIYKYSKNSEGWI